MNFYISLCDYNIQFKHIYVCHTLKVSNHILVVETLNMQGENINLLWTALKYNINSCIEKIGICKSMYFDQGIKQIKAFYRQYREEDLMQEEKGITW